MNGSVLLLLLLSMNPGCQVNFEWQGFLVASHFWEQLNELSLSWSLEQTFILYTKCIEWSSLCNHITVLLMVVLGGN